MRLPRWKPRYNRIVRYLKIKNEPDIDWGAVRRLPSTRARIADMKRRDIILKVRRKYYL